VQADGARHGLSPGWKDDIVESNGGERFRHPRRCRNHGPSFDCSRRPDFSPDEMQMKRFMAVYTAGPSTMEQPAGSIVEEGGPLSRVVEAASQEAAAKMFLEHPHFTIFPGEGVEIMECLQVPTM
jgi:hypothetical protein